MHTHVHSIHHFHVLLQTSAGVEVENVCKNAGRCINVGKSHQCQCQPGYMGSYCEEMVDECRSNPCRNGATCKDYQSTYECVVSKILNYFYMMVLYYTSNVMRKPS